ncbi:MAG: NAD-dependent epimerase/dehydratase family protein [Nannocystaceae bacterium]
MRIQGTGVGRRSFCGAVVGGALLAGCDGPAWPARILVLGGTGFVGPPIVEALRSRGHTVTIFNRGRTNPGLFADLEQLRGDREVGDLSALRGRSWDAVVDVSGVVPSWVEASARLLAPVVDRYVLISSTSVYLRFDLGPADESMLLRPDPRRLDDRGARYGERKAACERAAFGAALGRASAIRASFVVGPGDARDRLQAWLARVAEGGPSPRRAGRIGGSSSSIAATSRASSPRWSTTGRWGRTT